MSSVVVDRGKQESTWIRWSGLSLVAAGAVISGTVGLSVTFHISQHLADSNPQ